MKPLQPSDLNLGIPKKSPADKKSLDSREFKIGYMTATTMAAQQKLQQEAGEVEAGKAALEQGFQQLLALAAEIEAGIGTPLVPGMGAPTSGGGMPLPSMGGSPIGGSPMGGMPMGDMGMQGGGMPPDMGMGSPMPQGAPSGMPSGGAPAPSGIPPELMR